MLWRCRRCNGSGWINRLYPGGMPTLAPLQCMHCYGKGKVSSQTAAAQERMGEAWGMTGCDGEPEKAYMQEGLLPLKIAVLAAIGVAVVIWLVMLFC
jgi:hypothetical protein